MHLPNENRPSRATPRDRYEPVHCPVSKAGLTVSKFVEQRGDGRLKRGNDMVVPRVLASLDRQQSCVQEVKRGQKDLADSTVHEFDRLPRQDREVTSNNVFDETTSPMGRPTNKTLGTTTDVCTETLRSCKPGIGNEWQTLTTGL